jgi:hypothetical protein
VSRPKVQVDESGYVRRLHVHRCSCGKQAYSSRKRAKAAASHERKMSGELIHAYKAERCHSWHIGHPPLSRGEYVGRAS